MSLIGTGCERKVRCKMPHSLRARLGGLRYKKVISDKDYDRLCKALDNEKVLDKIRAEIEHEMIEAPYMYDDDHFGELYGFQDGLKDALHIIDKYRAESEEEHNEQTDKS